MFKRAYRWSVAFLLVACAHSPQGGPQGEDDLNLGFEEGSDGLPAGWSAGPAEDGFEVTTDAATVRTGRRSVRITATPEGRYGSLSRRIDAAPLVGKQVRVHGWVKTEGATGWPVTWLRVDGGQSTYVFSNSPAETSEGWTEVVADAMIAPGQDVNFGVAMGGEGTAWFDDLRIEVLEPVVAVPIQLSGAVSDPSGTPVPGAVVSLIAATGGVAQHVRTAADGGFALATTSGTWGLSASAPGRTDLVGTFVAQQQYSTGRSDLALRLSAEGGVTVEGQIGGAVPLDMYVQVSAYSTHDADVFALPVNGEGRFASNLPLADRFAVSVLAGGMGRGEAVREGDTARATLGTAFPSPTPEAVLSWISQNAIPLSTADPEGDSSDLAGLRSVVGDARVVALGEATHGTREFFQLKDRVFRYLVEDQGFSVFALEVGQADARAINTYLMEGSGTARNALADAGMWMWDTEEFLTLIEWMRAWNSDPSHSRKLQFVGFDMQSPFAAMRGLRRFLEQVAPDEATALLAPVDVLRHDAGVAALEAMSADEKSAVVSAVAAIIERFDTSEVAWVAASSPAAFATARQDARIVQQAAEHFSMGVWSPEAPVYRDRAMFENIQWLTDNLTAGTRMVVSAHNAHIGDITEPQLRMGHHMRSAFGPELVTIALELGGGSFQAQRQRQDGARSNIEEIDFPPPRDGTVNAALLRAGPPVFALDLRTLPADGEAAAWFRSPQFVWEIGYVFRTEAALTSVQTLAERFDALLFVAETTRARPLPIDLTRMP